MRSKSAKVIEVSVVRGKGVLPPFLPLVQRHFEKSLPATASNHEATLNASLDQLGMLLPDELLDSIESLEIHYRTKGA